MSEEPERIWIEAPEEMVPYFYEESELHDVAAPVLEYIRTDLVRAQIEAAVKRALEGAANVCGRPNGPWKASAWECRDDILSLDPAQFIEGDKT